MKKSKVLLIIQTIFMYLAQVPLVLMFILWDKGDNVIATFFITSLIIIAIALVLAVCNIVIFIVNVINNDDSYVPFKNTLISKLVLIPWYIVNFIICLIFFAATLNPFLLVLSPIVICVEIGITYIFMIATSLPNIIYSVRYIIKNGIKLNFGLEAGILFHFIFCLDLVGAFLFCKKFDKYVGIIDMTKEG